MRVLQKGAQLAGRYTLSRRLGSGGMSETWLARDSRTEKAVALKFLSARLTEQAGYARLLHAEWQLGSRLMHPNIVRVFEFHDDDQGPYFSLQYIGGPDISVVAGEEVGTILAPVALIADALRYAHAKGIVHRDIKASNILLDERGQPYLIDFGVAARGGEPGAGGGSAVASSPQQLAGQAPRPEDDIYALGVLIHELIGGQPPASGGGEPGRLKSASGGSVPSSITGLVSEMLADDPSARPDAVSVARRIADAAFPPGPVPVRLLGSLHAAELLPDDAAIRPVERAPLRETPAVVPVARRKGVSPRTLAGALATALIVFLTVVFVLPRFTVVRDVQLPEPAARTPEPRPAERDDEDDILFNENIDDLMSRDERVRLKRETESALGELLSKLETLETRAVGRWGGQVFKNAQAVYAAGDRAFLRRNYRLAGEKYREAIEIIDPLLDRVDLIFEETMRNGQAALEAGNSPEALRHYELAVAISPGHAGAHNGLQRAKNLDLVMGLTKQGAEHQKNLDLEAARLAYEKAVELDPAWQPAADGLQRTLVAVNQLSFDQRMTEGLEALAEGDFPTARAAFRAAQLLRPDSPEPADGLQQVDQGVRLQNIAALEQQAKRLEDSEQWEAAVETYNAILEVDRDLTFAHEGLKRARARSSLHRKLDQYIADPDSLSEPSTMQAATKMLLDITRMPSIGPRLDDQRNQLSRLLKRAATPLTVRLISDNATDVVIFKVGKLGSFESQEISLRPGKYVAVGSRPGYRDVRLEFRVAPEAELQPIVVRCEERI